MYSILMSKISKILKIAVIKFLHVYKAVAKWKWSISGTKQEPKQFFFAINCE